MNRRALLLVAVAVASVACSTEPGPAAVVADQSDRIGAPSPTADIGAGDVTGLPDTEDGVVAGVDVGNGTIVSVPGDSTFWISDSAWDDHEAWSDLVAAFPETGLWPLELEFLTFDDDGRPWRTSEFGPSEEPAAGSVTDILTTWSATGPVDELADAVEDLDATNVVPSEFGFEPAALGLVPVERSADVVARLGWWGAVNYDQRPSDMSAVLRSWEARFGAHLTRLGFDTMHLSVTRPPADLETGQALAVEHFAWCPGLAEIGIPLDEYAAQLVGMNEWYCWWD